MLARTHTHTCTGAGLVRVGPEHLLVRVPHSVGLVLWLHPDHEGRLVGTPLACQNPRGLPRSLPLLLLRPVTVQPQASCQGGEFWQGQQDLSIAQQPDRPGGNQAAHASVASAARHHLLCPPQGHVLLQRGRSLPRLSLRHPARNAARPPQAPHRLAVEGWRRHQAGAPAQSLLPHRLHALSHSSQHAHCRQEPTHCRTNHQGGRRERL